MRGTRLFVGLVVLSAMALGAGCFGPEEDPATTPEDEQEEAETTPGDTVIGGQPTAEPPNETAVTADGTETDDGGGTEDEETDGEQGEQEETTADEGDG